MAEVLNSDGRVWATDKLFLAYLAGTGALVAVHWNRLPEVPDLLALHVGAAIAIVLASTRGESAHYDCFPSGHGELTIIALPSSRQMSQQLSGAHFGEHSMHYFAAFTFDMTNRLTQWRTRCLPRS